MKIAVVGSGVSGHGAALALAHAGKDVTLFEKQGRTGGHANTVNIDYAGRRIAVDTGFIVYNELNYPNMTAFFEWAGVATQPSDMSFAVSRDNGAFEWSGRQDNPFGGLFAQKRNLLKPSFWLFLQHIVKFQKTARAAVAAGSLSNLTLGEYVAQFGSNRLRDDYIVPMGAAIWSMTLKETLAFPVESFLNFFENHKLLQWNRPVWRTVSGGSQSYVKVLGEKLGGRIRTNCGVASLTREEQGVRLVDMHGEVHDFDAAILATSAPAALQMLADAGEDERDVLRGFRVSANRAVLHRDTALMPKRKAAWAAWNVLKEGGDSDAAVTYCMNKLQGIDEAFPLFVTLNPFRPPARDLVFDDIGYEHPVYDARALASQKRLHEIQGKRNVWFAGAWTAYGFHEDGLRSGLQAAVALGGKLPWGGDVK